MLFKVVLIVCKSFATSLKLLGALWVDKRMAFFCAAKKKKKRI